MALDVARLRRDLPGPRRPGPTPRLTVDFGLRWRVLPEPLLTTPIRGVVVGPRIRVLTPENRALVEALLAYLEDGDVRPMWALIEERTGYPPDSLLKNRLIRTEFKRPKEWGPAEFWRMLDVCAPRLSQKADDRRPEGKRRRDVAEKFLGDSKSHPDLKRALSDYEEPEKETLRAVFLAEKELQSEESLTLGKIEWRIIRDNRPLKLKDAPDLNRLRKAAKAAERAHATAAVGTQEHQQTEQALREVEDRLERAEARFVFFGDLLPDGPPPDDWHPAFEDPSALAKFAAKHAELLLDELLRQAPPLLSPQRLEVFRLSASGLKNKEIAERVGRSENQVAQEKHQAYKDLRRKVG